MPETRAALIETEVGSIEVAVITFGANVRFAIRAMTSRVYVKVWEMPCFASFLMGREVAKVMVPRRRGTIFFTGATTRERGGAALRPSPPPSTACARVPRAWQANST